MDKALKKIEIDRDDEYGNFIGRLLENSGHSCLMTMDCRTDGKVVLMFARDCGEFGRLFARGAKGTPYNLPFGRDTVCREIVERIEKASMHGYDICLATDDGASVFYKAGAIDDADVIWPRHCTFYEMEVKLDLEGNRQ